MGQCFAHDEEGNIGILKVEHDGVPLSRDPSVAPNFLTPLNQAGRKNLLRLETDTFSATESVRPNFATPTPSQTGRKNILRLDTATISETKSITPNCSTSKSNYWVPSGRAVDTDSESESGKSENSKAESIVVHPGSTGAVKPITLTPVFVENVEVEELKRKVKDYVEADFVKPTIRCIDLLNTGLGGIVLILLHEKDLRNKIPCHFLDGGHHTGCFRKLAKSIYEENFDTLLRAFCMHSESDRWGQDELKELEGKIPGFEEFVTQLDQQPKDGAILLSTTGSVKGVSLHLRSMPREFDLGKDDFGKTRGTRHAAALGFAEFLARKRRHGVVMTRSDSGGVHVIFPHPDQEPRVLRFKTVGLPTQADLLEAFKKQIENAPEKQKVYPVLIRPARRGERIVTVVEGHVTADKTIKDDGLVVLRALSADHEQYVLSKKQAESTYVHPGLDLRKLQGMGNTHLTVGFGPSYAEDLNKLGFKIHIPKPGQYRRLYTVTEEDLALLSAPCFCTRYGAIQSLQCGSVLAVSCQSQSHKGSSIYLISRSSAELYAPKNYMPDHLETLRLLMIQDIEAMRDLEPDVSAAALADLGKDRYMVI